MPPGLGLIFLGVSLFPGVGAWFMWQNTQHNRGVREDYRRYIERILPIAQATTLQPQERALLDMALSSRGVSNAQDVNRLKGRDLDVVFAVLHQIATAHEF